jgi:DNA-binding PadR family transcriptional regulator
MRPLNDEEEAVMLALQDLLLNYKNEGLLNPSLYTIQEAVNDELESDKEELTAILRSLDKKGYVSASEAFRPRHPDPMVLITPSGWNKLNEISQGVPDAWLEAIEEILSILYENELQNWNDLTGNIHIQSRTLEDEVDIPGGIFDFIISYLLENEFITSDEKGYTITEKGAIAHEDKQYTGEIRGFQ